MDPKLAYWTGALLVMMTAVACALAGWREIRQGEVERHRRWMNATVVLVAVFLASYVFKVVLLGKEQLELWSRGAVITLRIHETFVSVMVLAGTAARILARQLPNGAGPTRRRHRWAGRTAVVASLFALLTAAMVLAGMYLRA